MKKSIVLIGMPASGKSTVGVILAKVLGMDFIDTDILLQKREGKKLNELISEHGIPGFLALEEKAVCDVQVQPDEAAVIATGGSVVYSRKAMEHLASFGRIVYLNIDYTQMMQRLDDIRHRGVILEEGKTLRMLYQERMPLYNQYAELVVHEGGKSPEEIVQELERRLGQADE